MDQSDRDTPAPDGLAPFEMCLLDIRGWKLCPGWTQSQLGMLQMLREVRLASVAVPEAKGSQSQFGAAGDVGAEISKLCHGPLFCGACA